jgi:NADH dehydrogenase
MLDPAIIRRAADSGARPVPDGKPERAAIDGIPRLIRVLPLDGNDPGAGAGFPEPLYRNAATSEIRVGHVYGVGEDPITLFLIMMRSLPAVPVLSPTYVLRPVWHEDLALAVAATVASPASAIRSTAILTADVETNYQELYDRISRLTDRHPLRLPVPDFLATHGKQLAEALGTTLPLALSTFDTRSAPQGASGAAASWETFGLTPTDIDEGLRRLIMQLDEITPAEGTGTVEIKRFWTVIHGSPLDAAGLIRAFRRHFKDVMPSPVGVEPAAPAVELDPNAVLTIALPGRGHVQIRVEEVTEKQIIVATLRGHILAGIVRFSAEPAGDAIRFEVMTCDAAADPIHWLSLTLGGTRVQDANWHRVVNNVVTLSAGQADKVESDSRRLSDEEADDTDRWIRNIIRRARAVDTARA